MRADPAGRDHEDRQQHEREQRDLPRQRRASPPTVSTSAITLVTTPDNADVNARCAPMTSLLSRLTSAPVWVRVKNAIGMRWTCSNTCRRRSRISPSPSCDDWSRSSKPTTASTSAMRRDQPPPATTTVPVHVAVDDGVDGPAREQRRGHAEHRGDRGEQQEGRRSCAACGRANAATRRRSCAGSPSRRACRPVLHRALERHPHVAVHDVHPRSSSSLEVKTNWR